MSFEKYGHKLINLLSKIEHKLNPNAQIGGGDGPETNADENGPYVKILSYSVNHVSVLVHLEKDGDKTALALENPQISYEISQQTSNQKVEEYSIEQQLRLGCDNKGNMYKYSVVLTRHPKKEGSEPIEPIEESATETSNAVKALGELSGAFENLSKAVTNQS
jgi:hypothetical protein